MFGSLPSWTAAGGNPAALARSSRARAFAGFVAWLEALYETEMPHFIERNYDSAIDLLARPAAVEALVRSRIATP